MGSSRLRFVTAALAGGLVVLTACGGGGSLDDVADDGCAMLAAAGPDGEQRGAALGDALVEGARHGHPPEETLEAMLATCPELLPGIDGVRVPTDRDPDQAGEP